MKDEERKGRPEPRPAEEAPAGGGSRLAGKAPASGRRSRTGGYAAAVFDMDGTILDTLDDLMASTNRAMAAEGLPPRSRAEIRSFLGNGMAYLIAHAVPGGTDQEREQRVFQGFLADYKIHCADQTRAYEGIPEVIQALRDQGVKTAVVSNKGDFAVQDLTAQYFPGLFDAVTGERKGVRRKPAPDAVETVLRELGIPKEEAVYIGDSEVDLQTAGNAGLDAILVTWGFRERDFLARQGAVTFAERPEELVGLITGGNRD